MWIFFDLGSIWYGLRDCFFRASCFGYYSKGCLSATPSFSLLGLTHLVVRYKYISLFWLICSSYLILLYSNPCFLNPCHSNFLCYTISICMYDLETQNNHTLDWGFKMLLFLYLNQLSTLYLVFTGMYINIFSCSWLSKKDPNSSDNEREFRIIYWWPLKVS